MAEASLRIAVVGAGFWAPFQISGWHEVPGVRCVAVWNRTLAKAEALAQRFDMQAFDDVERMIDEVRPDVLDVITNVETHAEYTALGARKGVAVVCQKPMGVDLAEARQMVATCEAAGVPFLVNENWRFQTPMLRVRQLLDQGVIGRPFRGRVVFSTSFPVFDNQPFLAEVDRFILADIGSHILDTARFLFGEASSLVCQTQRVNPKIKGEDVATVMMRMSGCETVICDMSYASRLRDESFPQTYLVIEGSEGSIELRKDYRILVTNRDGETEEVATPPSYPWLDPAYLLVHSSIVDCQRAIAADLRGEAASGVRGHQNLRTVELVDASYRSAESGEIVRF